MPVPMTPDEMIRRKVAAEHVISKSLTSPARRLAVGLPLYSCSCGEWDSYDANFDRHIEAEARQHQLGFVNSDPNRPLDQEARQQDSSAPTEQVNDDKHWHRGPSQSCSICRFGTRQQDGSALREALIATSTQTIDGQLCWCKGWRPNGVPELHDVQCEQARVALAALPPSAPEERSDG